MNLGLILSKPGESNLALASRLWISNRYSWHLDSMHISDRIEEEIQSQLLSRGHIRRIFPRPTFPLI